ncbi:MAG: helix-turn-helix domain-containing protein [Rhodanobacteraceae bacterium]|nr:helix-turn-helix domain-containing protein [Rhodanobacteraceae bacterium]
MKAKRQGLGLTQKEAAKLLQVGAETVLHWEKDQTTPPDASWPTILQFLGYDPHPEPTSLPERLKAVRRQNGWSIKRAARFLGVDEGTWAGWESGRAPRRRHAHLVAEAVG